MESTVRLTIKSTRISPHTRGTRNIFRAQSKHRKLMLGGIHRLIPGRSVSLPLEKVMEVLGHIKELNRIGLVTVLGPGNVPVDLEALPEIRFLSSVPASSAQRMPFVDTIQAQDTFTGHVMPSSLHGSSTTGEVFDDSATKTLAEIDRGLAEEDEPAPSEEEPESLEVLAALDEALEGDEEEEDTPEEASNASSVVPSTRRRRRRPKR